MTRSPFAPGRWEDGPLPANVTLGENTLISGPSSFKRFRGRRPDALVIGAHCTMDAVHFAVGPQGRLKIGDYCYFSSAVLLCELELQIGNYVVIGWNTTIADSDFHPLDPAQRIADAIALSPASHGRARPRVEALAVAIEDDVWIGPAATILKGLRIGSGAVIEPGTMVTRDVPPRAVVGGNPARVRGESP